MPEIDGSPKDAANALYILNEGLSGQTLQRGQPYFRSSLFPPDKDHDAGLVMEQAFEALIHADDWNALLDKKDLASGRNYEQAIPRLIEKGYLEAVGDQYRVTHKLHDELQPLLIEVSAMLLKMLKGTGHLTEASQVGTFRASPEVTKALAEQAIKPPSH